MGSPLVPSRGFGISEQATREINLYVSGAGDQNTFGQMASDGCRTGSFSSGPPGLGLAIRHLNLQIWDTGQLLLPRVFSSIGRSAAILASSGVSCC